MTLFFLHLAKKKFGDRFRLYNYLGSLPYPQVQKMESVIVRVFMRTKLQLTATYTST